MSWKFASQRPHVPARPLRGRIEALIAASVFNESEISTLSSRDLYPDAANEFDAAHARH